MDKILLGRVFFFLQERKSPTPFSIYKEILGVKGLSRFRFFY